MAEIEKNTMEEEIDKAIAQAKKDSKDSFTLTMKKPFEWDGKTFDTLTFNWGKLTGKDFFNIEQEINAEGFAVITPEFSTKFIMYMAVRACEQPLTTDALSGLPIKAFNRIRSKARNFLMSSEM